MVFEIITLFPIYFFSFFRTGLMRRAVNNGLISYRVMGLRKYGEGRLKKVDDAPFGGSEGMVIKNQVLENCLKDCRGQHVIALSPRGEPLTCIKARSLSKKDSLTIVCGHYEGVDQRFIDSWVDEEISIGDYVLSGGETASLVLMEAVSRYLDGFMGNPESYQNESFESMGLEHDQYTKPFSQEVPSILLSGNHSQIKQWKEINSLLKTYRRRPDLFKKRNLLAQEEEMVKNYFYQSLTQRV